MLLKGVKMDDLDHTVVVNQPSFKEENNFLCMASRLLVLAEIEISGDECCMQCVKL